MKIFLSLLLKEDRQSRHVEYFRNGTITETTTIPILEPKASSCDDDQASGGKGQCY